MNISSRRNEANIYSSSSIRDPLDNTQARSEILEYPNGDDNMISHLDIADVAT